MLQTGPFDCSYFVEVTVRHYICLTYDWSALDSINIST